MFSRAAKLVFDIILGIILNIIAAYLILPKFLHIQNTYFNVNDVYLAIYVGLIMSAIELAVVFIGVVIFVN